MDTVQIQAARAALVEANREVDNMAEGYRRAAQQEEVLNRGLRNGASAADGMLGRVKSLVATWPPEPGAKAVLGLSDQLASSSARLSLIVDDGGSRRRTGAENHGLRAEVQGILLGHDADD